MRIGSLFSGAGGLDLAVEAVFSGTVVWQAEIDKAASKVLAHRFPGVPNLGSVTDIDWATVPPVDVLCGGFPCQDVSAAGKRAGIKAGTRSGLWSEFAEAIDALRPRIVVVENVRGLLSATAHRVESDEATVGDGSGGPVLRAAGAVLGDLADLGYDAQWATVAASDVGAPHRRERVFIVATDAESPRWGIRDTSDERQAHREVNAFSDDCGAVADSPRDGWDEGRPESAGLVGGFNAAVGGDGPVDLLPTPTAITRERTPREVAERMRTRSIGSANLDEVVIRDFQAHLLPTPNASDASGGGQHPDKRVGHSRQLIDYALLCAPSAADGGGGRLSRSGERNGELLLPGQAREMVTAWGKYEPAIRRWETLTRSAPAPTEPNKNGNPRLSAAFSEWLMGWPEGWVTDPAIGISRNDQLRIVGNGVVSLQCEYALRYLLAVTA